jgi:hypothetical protein
VQQAQITQISLVIAGSATSASNSNFIGYRWLYATSAYNSNFFGYIWNSATNVFGSNLFELILG